MTSRKGIKEGEGDKGREREHTARNHASGGEKTQREAKLHETL